MEITRRKFLKFGLSGVVAASGYGLAKGLGSGAYLYDYLKPTLDEKAGNYYRGMVGFDKVVRTTCAGNCTQACGWKALIKGNTIVRTEPASDYDCFDPVAKKAYLPRGCIRGSSYLEYIYGPTRLKTPLVRTGPRGSGQFRRASWDEALDLIADRLLKIIKEDGPEAFALFSPIPSYNYISAASGYRLGTVMGASGPLSFYDWYCDLPAGEPETWGVQTEECEEWDWTNAKLILLWGANIAESRMPATHFVTEAKYKGTKVISILTDYNATSKIANVSVSPRPGTDAALAMGIIKELIDHKWYDEEYIKTFTDLPFIIRKDNHKFLTENDVVAGGSKYKLYVWDKNSNNLILAPGTLGDDRDTLDWDTIQADPELEYTGTVTLVDGGTVETETVWLQLNRSLAKDYSLGQVEKITGVNAKVIQSIATDLHKYSPACIIEGGGANHWYHNDLNNRSMILLMALTGNVGINGGGFHQYTGQYRVWLKGMAKYIPLAKSKSINTTLFVWTHFDKQIWRLNKNWQDIVSDIETGQLKKLPDGSAVSNDSKDEPGYRQYLLIKSLSEGSMPVYPQPPKKPRAMMIWRGNFVNNGKGGYHLLDWFKDEKKLELVFNLDYRMSTTSLYSDVVLPAASWYEKLDIETTPLHPYFQLQQACVKPVFESKPDFEIFRLIMQRIQKKAREMKAAGTWDAQWVEKDGETVRDFTKVYDLFIDKEGKENPFYKGQGEGALDNPEKVAHFIVKNSPILFPDEKKYSEHKERFAPELQPVIEEYLSTKDADVYADAFLKLAKKGPIPFPALQPDRPHNPFRENIERKLPWPAGGKHAPELVISMYPCVLPAKLNKTLTGRQQFYIDHDYYITLGETLPGYKVPEVDLASGKPASLKMNTPHGKFRTHSMFSELSILLRLQRGEATIQINKGDAEDRNIADGDLVEVFNDYGKFVCRAMIVPGIGPSQLRIDHAWESYQYHEGYFNFITPVRPNPTQSVKYPQDPDAPDHHLKFAWNLWGVTGNECDTSVEIRKVK
ncbi:molybdopterin-dependent oxidoreductase [Syntrophomonas erecta subsp. sporosyntropha]